MSLFRIVANIIILSGIVLLAKLLYTFFGGQLVLQTYSSTHDSWTGSLFALALKIPIPLHVISVGMILQRKWLSPALSKFAWCSVVISGCWLGAALAIRWLHG